MLETNQLTTPEDNWRMEPWPVIPSNAGPMYRFQVQQDASSIQQPPLFQAQKYQHQVQQIRPRVTLPITIEGRTVFATLESGSEENMISLALVKQHALVIDSDAKHQRDVQLPNGKVVRTQGRINNLSCRFANGPETIKGCTLYILDALISPLIMGMTFLEETETLSKHRHRLHREESLVKRMPQVCSLNPPKRRIFCFADGTPALASADTGSDMNLISLKYAIRMGFRIDCIDNEQERFVQFADGTSSSLHGKVTLLMRFADGEGPPAKTFYVLKNLNCYILIGNDLLEDINAFEPGQHDWYVEEDAVGPSELSTIVWFNPLERMVAKLGRGRNNDEPKTSSRSTNELIHALDELEARENARREAAFLAKVPQGELDEQARELNFEIERGKLIRKIEHSKRPAETADIAELA